jgi:hypothetical protein
MNPATDWIDQARIVLDMLKESVTNSVDAGADGHGSDCRWCPLCQAAAVVRGERPEVSAALADVLMATATALRQFAEAGRPDGTTAPAAAATPADAEPAAAHGPFDPPPVVQRIEIA